jgi:hypothetical protein
MSATPDQERRARRIVGDVLGLVRGDEEKSK